MRLTHRFAGKNAVEPLAISIELGQIPAASQIRYRNPHECRLNSAVRERRDLPHSFSQKLDTFRNPIDRNRRISDTEITTWPVVAPEKRRPGLDQHAVLAQITCELIGIHAFRSFDPECRAAEGRFSGDFQSFTIKRVDHDDMALVIFYPHTVDDRIIVTKRQKIGGGSLLMARRMTQHECP